MCCRRQREGGFAAKWPPLAAKDLSLLVGSCCFVRCFEVCRTSELPEEGFNCCGAKLRLRCAESRFAKPRCSLQRERFSCFSLVRKEPKVHQRFANLWTPGTIQIAGRQGVFAKTTGVHQVTGFAKTASFPGIAGNDLNRCDAPALQHKIRAKSKRTAVFFANSRLRVVRMGGGGQKRVILGRNKESLCE